MAATARKDCPVPAPQPVPAPPDPGTPPRGHRDPRGIPPMHEVHAPPYLPSYDKRRIYSLSARGVDPGLQGLSSDPFSSSPPQYSGLRVPSLVPAGAPGAAGRYLFLLATRIISRPTRLRGIGQSLSIGATFTVGSEIDQQLVSYEQEVTTPTWRFPDGNVSWHLVYDNDVRKRAQLVTTDSVSFAHRSSNSPALLYDTFATSADAVGSTAPGGGPVDYSTGLVSYAPPTIWAGWKPVVADLYNFNDVRFPMRQSDRMWTSLDVPIRMQQGLRRVSLYASILQTGGTFQGVLTGQGLTSFAGFAPEDQFIATVQQTSQAPTVTYFRVNGSLVWEDE